MHIFSIFAGEKLYALSGADFYDKSNAQNFPEQERLYHILLKCSLRTQPHQIRHPCLNWCFPQRPVVELLDIHRI